MSTRIETHGAAAKSRQVVRVISAEQKQKGPFLIYGSESLLRNGVQHAHQHAVKNRQQTYALSAINDSSCGSRNRFLLPNCPLDAYNTHSDQNTRIGDVPCNEA